MKFLDEYCQAQRRQINSSRAGSQDKWEPPEAGLVKVNFDRAVDASRGIGGAGAILRDPEGSVMGACSCI
ncbi:hypothetical protein REPUB_Repub18cG0052000 [Reevesia pubescens]